jgi:aryl-alcohol dehydrogenase-like predicted oxidoreductase
MAAFFARKLGRSGIEVSPLGLGCWAIGGPWQWMGGPGGWGEVDDGESIRAIHAGLENGINFFDTAANYGTGHSERILGQALSGRRHQAVIATKFGFVVDETNMRVSRFQDNEAVIQDVRTSCEASLRRLGTDYIDLFQLHVWDYPADLAVKVRAELEGLVREGKIRAYGWSTDSPELALIFTQGEHCAAIQHDLNVVMDAPEMLALCEQQDLASVNRSPLARGALTGKYSKTATFSENDVRRDEWSIDHFFTPTIEKLDTLRSILTSNGRTLAQGALSWALCRSPKTIPIPGFRTVKQVEENASTMQLSPLSPDQMSEIDNLLGRTSSPA